MRIEFDEAEVRELRYAVLERAESLRKLKGKMQDAGLSTTEPEYHLAVLMGNSEEPGLIGKLSEQIHAFEEAARPADDGLPDQIDAITEAEMEAEGVARDSETVEITDEGLYDPGEDQWEYDEEEPQEAASGLALVEDGPEPNEDRSLPY